MRTRINKSQPDPGSVHVNRPLTNFSLMYAQEAADFIADSFALNLPVDKKTDEFFKYPKGFRFRDAMQKRAPNSESAGIGYKVATDTYRTDVFALHMDIPDEVRANEDSPLNSDRTATETLTALAMIRREKSFASAFLTTGLWTRDVQGVASGASSSQVNQWSTAGATPVADMIRERKNMKQSTGVFPNTMVVGQEVDDALQTCPDILDRIKYIGTPGAPAQVSPAILSSLFKMRYIVGSAVEDTSNDLLTESNSMSYIVGKKILLGYVAPSAGVMKPMAAMTFSWRGLTGTTNMGSRMRKFRMEGNSADRVEIDMAFGHKIIAPDLATLLYDVVA